MNWLRKLKEVHLIVSLKEQQRIAEGLEYVKDNSVSFTTGGRKQKLAYDYKESREVRDNKEIIHRQWWYYYWDDYFLYWTRACGHQEHTENDLTTVPVND